MLKNKSKIIYKNYFFSKKNFKPYVFGKLAISKDYYLKDKSKFYITNNESLKTAHILRSRVNCILTSSNTINDDNPKLNCRIDGLKKNSPYIAILDKNLKIKKKSFLVNNAKNNKTYIFYNRKNKDMIKYLKLKKMNLIYTPLYKEKLNFNFILKKLYKYEINSVLVEGGKTLVSSLLDNGYFNEFYLFISSKSLKKKGILKMKNIKYYLSKKFKKTILNETYLDKDRLIHYY